ncbi:hypothetical protein F5Y00DRAFT_274592 [Daldinia vernicosa]|uniref:uncharacterized protein n=1 Tax=Daldinia vernicosa TaxID=114800 RepID=UPI0020077F0D|nr:uncharacterized protein F5Y00DRAFT_274592 [Daldinia vernicosa]KAI0851683.1 hypothetical protein F5Y00DRAFT_274592 [Daldinia vernicosa]
MASRPGEPSASPANSASQPLENTLNQEIAPADQNDVDGNIQMNDEPRHAPASRINIEKYLIAPQANRRRRDGGSGNNPPAVSNPARTRSRSPPPGRREDQNIRMRDNSRSSNDAGQTAGFNWNPEVRGYLTYDDRGNLVPVDENMNLIENSTVWLDSSNFATNVKGPQAMKDYLRHMDTHPLSRPEYTVKIEFHRVRGHQHIRSVNPSMSQEASMGRDIDRQGTAPARAQSTAPPQAPRRVPQHPAVLPPTVRPAPREPVALPRAPRRVPREPDPRPQEPPVDSKEPPAEAQYPPLQPRVLVCANCGAEGHNLRDCVTHWTPSGDIPGCYRCNSMDHTIDTCQIQPPIDDAARYIIEVVNRAGRPPLRSTRGWNELAVAMNHRVAGPISRMRMISLSPAHFNQWDYSIPAQQQEDKLVLDPATGNLEQIRALPDQGYVPPRR